jgi:hypothetical protein
VQVYAGLIDRVVRPHLGSLEVASVTPADIVSMIETCKQPWTVCDTLLVVCRTIFAHAIGRRQINVSPAVGIDLKAILGQRPPKRRRVRLQQDELEKLLPNIDDLIGRQHGLMFRVLLSAKQQRKQGPHDSDGEGAIDVTSLGNLAASCAARVSSELSCHTESWRRDPVRQPVVRAWIYRYRGWHSCGSRAQLPSQQGARRLSHGFGRFHFSLLLRIWPQSRMLSSVCKCDGREIAKGNTGCVSHRQVSPAHS